MSIHAEVNIDKLGWMTGTWRGSMGEIEVEESWNTPRAGSIQALVRILNNGQLMIIEVVDIEECNESLCLYIQQWNAGLGERDEGRQLMELVELKNREVSFRAQTKGMLEKLTYRRVSDVDFQIDVVQASGAQFTMHLKSLID